MSLAVVLILAAVPFTAAAENEVWVGDDTKAVNYDTIQEAIEAVDDGGTVNVAAGVYAEQVIINKNVTLIGHGEPVIKAPASPVIFKVPESSGRFEPVIFAFGGENTAGTITGPAKVNVNISGFVVDGDARCPADRSAGIMLRNVIGNISDNSLDNFDLTKQTFGIIAYGDCDLIIDGNCVSGFGRGGILVCGDMGDLPKPIADIRNNEVNTFAPSTWAQNGIQIGWGASGNIRGNIVSGNVWGGGDWGASGIIIPGASDVVISDNTVSGSDYGIAIAGYGNYSGPHPSANITISGNTLYGNGSAIGLQGDVTDTLIEDNEIYDNEYGISSFDHNPGDWTGGGLPLSTTAIGNNFHDNEYGVAIWVDYYDLTPEDTVFSGTGNEFTNNRIQVFQDEVDALNLADLLANNTFTPSAKVEGDNIVDMTEEEIIGAAITAAIDAIADLPEELTLADKDAVEAARALVDFAFGAGADASDITNLDVLRAAEDTIADLEKSAEPQLPITGINIVWLIPVGCLLVLVGAFVLRRQVIA